MSEAAPQKTDRAGGFDATPADGYGSAGIAGRARRRLCVGLFVATAVLMWAGLAAGSDGWSLPSPGGWHTDVIASQIRAPRTLGAWLVGALLGVAGAVAQGLFRNPLADPFLLGSASGASLAVVLVLAAGSLGGGVIGWSASQGLLRLGLVGAAFVGAFAGVALTLALARGAQQTPRLLLAGVVVGVVLSALGDLVSSAAPEALRGKQVFMLGTTGFLGWGSVAVLGAGVLLTVPIAWRLARLLDALTLGEDSARSLGLALARWRLVLVAVLALATGIAVSQAGLVAFVGLAAPHLVRRCAPAPNGYTVLASAAAGGVLLLAADVLARTLIAPLELPVGVLTAVLGGAYLLWLLRQRRIR